VINLSREAARALRQREPGLLAYINLEISLALDQLGRIQTQRLAWDDALRRACTEVGTELLQMEAVRWWYQPERMERWRDQQRLRARRADLESERLRQRSTLEQQTRAIEDRLCTLLVRHRQLTSGWT
jgi:hypothetical protein